jgi:hypothetical protein
MQTINTNVFETLTLAHDAFSVPPATLTRYLPAGHVRQAVPPGAAYVPCVHCLCVSMYMYMLGQDMLGKQCHL